MPQPIKSILITAFGPGRNPQARQDTLKQLVQTLPEHSTISVTPHLQEQAPSIPCTPLESFQGDLIVVLGGDGSMLKTAETAVRNQIPLIGINLGSLGFLTDLTQETAVSSLLEIIQGRYRTAERITLHWSVNEHSGIAVNDVVLTHQDAVHIINFDLAIDDHPVNQQKADGMLICTPTGSTAYNLSAGGPIISPDLSCFGILSINPHRLNSKPMIVSDHHTLVLTSKHTKTKLWADGHGIDIGISPVTITKHTLPLRLIHPESYRYTDPLQKKLGWEFPHAHSH